MLRSCQRFCSFLRGRSGGKGAEEHFEVEYFFVEMALRSEGPSLSFDTCFDNPVGG